VQKKKKRSREKLKSHPQGDAEHDEATKKSFLKERSVSFLLKKSFLRECRAKYHRNIRQRSSKVVPKGMPNLYRRNRRRRSSKVVPKRMQNLHRKINSEH
jgi:predicted transposase YbfD/YdcC